MSLGAEVKGFPKKQRFLVRSIKIMNSAREMAEDYSGALMVSLEERPCRQSPMRRALRAGYICSKHPHVIDAREYPTAAHTVSFKILAVPPQDLFNQ
ncbi:hypothetical protein ACLOJK_004834, partial [Asimina triloba]